MTSITSCRLCSFACYEFKRLYEDTGESNEVYQIALKYFSPALLDAGTESILKVICLECWQHISDFHSFQQWILNAQAQEEEYKFIIHEKKADISEDNILSIFQCNTCREIFQSSLALDDHCQLVHPVTNQTENFDTKLVSTECKGGGRIAAHSTYKPKDENSFKCETCGASFSQYGNLRRHVRKKHAVQPLLKWICKHCNKMFKNRLNLERHKNKLHDCNYNNKPDDETNYKMDCGPEEYKSDFAVEDENGPQDLKQTFYNTRFSKREVHNNAENVESDLHMPALDIVDIKSEISTNEESDEGANEVAKDLYYDQSSSGTEEECDDIPTKWKGYFECPRCNQRVNNYSELSEHFVLKHPEERCYLNCCHLILCDDESIEEHLQFHDNQNAFECADCGKCFKNRKGLSSHKLQVHTDNRSSYHLHLCYCKRAKELYAETQQTEYDTFICCPRKKKILEDDAVIRKWKTELICEICNAKFAYYSLMRAHFYREHPGEKCYILCCHRKMSRISDALQHIRFHLDPHAYRCKICNLDFSGKNTLTKHMRNVHTDSLPKHRWACDECDKTFEIRQILTRHKNVCHSKQVV